MSYVEVCHVGKVIRGDTVLKDVSVRVERGQVVGLQGENGSGKTMTMRVVCGLVRPSSGIVIIGGMRLWKDASFPPSIGLLIEEPALLGTYSGLDNLRLMASIRGTAQEGDLRQSMQRVGLDPSSRKWCRGYSLGMRQRLGIAMALMEVPELLVLDEPTNSLDEDGVDDLVGIIGEERNRGAAVLVSSHDAEFLGKVCDVRYKMRSGKVVEVVGATERHDER